MPSDQPRAGASHLDGVDKETLEVVNEHWGKFPPQHPLINHVVGICFFFLWAVNFFGNGSVCYIFLKVKSLRTPSNMFVVNLAFSDLCMMTTMGLPVIINAFTQRYWMWGPFGDLKIKLNSSDLISLLRSLSALRMFRSHLRNLLDHDDGRYWLRQIQRHCEGIITIVVLLQSDKSIYSIRDFLVRR